MEKLQLFLQIIKAESIKNKIIQQQSLLLEEIYKLLDQIKTLNNVKQAESYFDQLLSIQEVLASLVFKYELEVSDQLWKFIRDCDRLDDPWLRDHLFKKIKNNQYSLEQEPKL